jgi:hypothetical protein
LIIILKKLLAPLIVLLVLTLQGGPVCAQETVTTTTRYLPHVETIDGKQGNYFFYKGYDYGTQSLIHPLRLIINGGFGIMQVSNRHNEPGRIMYGRGARNVTQNLLNPHWSISINGAWDFLSREVIPISINSGQAQYWPNYMNHLIGGGMSYRMMQEYYRYHEVDHPTAWAGATIFAYHFLNEIVENDGYEGPSTDPVADFWIFNPAGIILFSNENVARFFSRTLNMADWSYQPVWLPGSEELVNNGQNYSVKYHLNDKGSKSIFYHWGTHAELGLSFTRPDGQCVSVGLGMVAKNLFKIDQISKTVDVAVSGGVFYDRNNSLMASLLFARTKDYRYRLNLYPGLVKVGPMRPGFFASLNEDNRVLLGLTFGTLQHVPIGIGGAFNDVE